jgi:anaphase-promoting complex subunit 4
VPFTKHEFTDGPSSAPERLAVNGRKGRRAVCIAAEDGIHYRVFDIDSAEDADDQDAAQTEESDEGVEL